MANRTITIIVVYLGSFFIKDSLNNVHDPLSFSPFMISFGSYFLIIINI